MAMPVHLKLGLLAMRLKPPREATKVVRKPCRTGQREHRAGISHQRRFCATVLMQLASRDTRKATATRQAMLATMTSQTCHFLVLVSDNCRHPHDCDKESCEMRERRKQV